MNETDETVETDEMDETDETDETVSMDSTDATDSAASQQRSLLSNSYGATAARSTSSHIRSRHGRRAIRPWQQSDGPVSVR